ncbi:hypothetical protein NEOLEDRAFT_1193316 [Neolentinus lepideus HHB14362 ss-1]|uniref:Uncharacterized protein n=1 Tax=Neolentinus lepideus HHB14362 ss-1 TaxID=1314782 RepID=A0A165TWE9_9AGAM|nr:hypothetical protein NEOLEDRAFT_1193316 [Neolentinus lepideus HHB14362 ss-1]
MALPVLPSQRCLPARAAQDAGVHVVVCIRLFAYGVSDQSTDIKPESILALESTTLLDTLAADEAAQPSPCKILGDRSIHLLRNDFGPLCTLPRFLTVSDFDVTVRGDGNEPLTHWAQPDDFRVPEVTLRRV